MGLLECVKLPSLLTLNQANLLLQSLDSGLSHWISLGRMVTMVLVDLCLNQGLSLSWLLMGDVRLNLVNYQAREILLDVYCVLCYSFILDVSRLMCRVLLVMDFDVLDLNLLFNLLFDWLNM